MFGLESPLLQSTAFVPNAVKNLRPKWQAGNVIAQAVARITSHAPIQLLSYWQQREILSSWVALLAGQTVCFPFSQGLWNRVKPWKPPHDARFLKKAAFDWEKCAIFHPNLGPSLQA